ncbi:hypothetical protein ES703_15759 [subsurface metagenome]
MADIQLPKAEFQRGEIKIGLNLKDYLPNNEKKSLANLSDTELAELSPEELEQAKKAKENLLGIKKADMEVRQMENQEQWSNQVQALVEKHGISVDEAELLLKRRMGLEKPPDFSAWMQLMQPKVSPIETAIATAIGARAEQIVGNMFPSSATGGPNVTGQGTPPQENPIVGLLEKAKAAGVQSLYLPDGTLFNLGEPKKESDIGERVRNQVTTWVDGMIQERLPQLLPGAPVNGKPAPDLTNLSSNPEILRLYFEDRWKAEDRAADDIRDASKITAFTEIAAAVGAAFSPEGYEKLKKLLKEGPSGRGAASQEGKGQNQSQSKQGEKAKLLRATCRRCMRVFPYEEGEEPVCPYCSTYQKVECPSCGEIFIPQAGKAMVCPKCHAELEQPQLGAKEQEGTPEPESPAVIVGGGFLE